MPLSLKLLAGALVGLWLLADASVVDAAGIAALASIANTWLLVTRDQRIARLERRIRELTRAQEAKRTATRGTDRDVVVIDSDRIESMAHELEP